MMEAFAAIVGASIAGLIGFAAVAFQQDRERAYRVRAAARALLQDLKRIREEIGRPRGMSFQTTFYGQSAIPPQIHRWSEPLISQLAEEQGDLVLHFLRLERHLTNFANENTGLRRAVDALETAESDVTTRKERSVASIPKRWPVQALQDAAQPRMDSEVMKTFDWETFGKLLEEEWDAKRRVTGIQRAIDDLRDFLASSYDRVIGELNQLDPLLSAIADRPIARWPWPPMPRVPEERNEWFARP